MNEHPDAPERAEHPDATGAAAVAEAQAYHAEVCRVLADAAAPWPDKRRHLAVWDIIDDEMTGAFRFEAATAGLFCRITPERIAERIRRHPDHWWLDYWRQLFPEVPVTLAEAERAALTPDTARADIGVLTHVAVFGVEQFARQHGAALGECTEATRRALTVQAAVAYLVGYGLVARADAEAFTGVLPLSVAEPFLADLADAVAHGVAQARQVRHPKFTSPDA